MVLKLLSPMAKSKLEQPVMFPASTTTNVFDAFDLLKKEIEEAKLAVERMEKNLERLRSVHGDTANAAFYEVVFTDRRTIHAGVSLTLKF